MTRFYRIIFFSCLACSFGCSTSSSTEEIADDHVDLGIEGVWLSEGEKVEVSQGKLKCTFDLNEPNETLYICNIVENDEVTGFVCGQIEEAYMNGQDVSAAYESEYLVVYVSKENSMTLQVDAIQSTIPSLPDVHKFDNSERHFTAFRRVD